VIYFTLFLSLSRFRRSYLHINATETIIKDKTGLWGGGAMTKNASGIGLKYELMIIRDNIGYSVGYNMVDKTAEIGIKIKIR